MMKKVLAYFFACVGAIAVHTAAVAQEDYTIGIRRSASVGLEYEIRAGINIGGTSPLPLPVEIRQIGSYSPTFCSSIEGNAVKWFGERRKWGMLLGLRIETKGMETDARVKNYRMEIVGDGGERIKGNWTGGVRTKYRGTMFTVPVSATYRINKRLRLDCGPYISFATDGDFSGHVYEGYLRENDPTGDKVVFEDDRIATYDFSDDLRTVQYGLQAGVNWKAFKHLTVSGSLLWGLNGIFKKDFDTVTFTMYPVYMNIGFGYAF